MARPKKPIDPEQVEKLVAINCSVEEVADFFDVDRRTIQRRFAAALKKGRSSGRISLKRRMWDTAMSNNKGSVTMQIWLSKQMLAYTDKVDQTTAGSAFNTGPSVVVTLPSNGSESTVENGSDKKEFTH